MLNSKTGREPFFHLVKRDNIPKWQAWLIRGGAVVAALVLGAIITGGLTGSSGFTMFFQDLFLGVFGTPRRILNFFQNTAIMLIIALALAPAFKMKFWNIGAEGQVLMGGLGCVVCIQYLGGKIDESLLIFIMFIVSALFSTCWAVIPALFKAQFNTNETLFTLMMNYIAIQLVALCIYVWVPTGSAVLGVLKYGQLPLINGQRYVLNIIIVAIIMVLMFVYFRFSKHGYELSVVGESENTAKYIGINVKKVIIRTMILSGVLCGVAGFLLVSGTSYTLSTNTVGGKGFTAILVAWLGKFNPLTMGFTSMLYVFINQGAAQAATDLGLGGYYADIISGIFFFLIIACEFFINYRIKFRSFKKKTDNDAIDSQASEETSSVTVENNDGEEVTA
ncbi:MAG: ABC transporter permease [Acutalibacteraceae bacterium]